ncbi:Uncharacterised protein [Mycobacteroides abscessus subsp. abscessus]|nr:Uncharacterised protein [Mycobacteroides abscessus subsp. abscessus]
MMFTLPAPRLRGTMKLSTSSAIRQSDAENGLS